MSNSTSLTAQKKLAIIIETDPLTESELAPYCRGNGFYPEPRNKLSQAERGSILEVCNSAQYASLPPSQIVPALLDEGLYIASLSTFYRMLKQVGQLAHSERSRVRKQVSKPTTYTIKQANEVCSWDITYCHSKVRSKQQLRTAKSF